VVDAINIIPLYGNTAGGIKRMGEVKRGEGLLVLHKCVRERKGTKLKME
jgi:hypothetical protein